MIDNAGDVFFRFSFISTHISLDLLSLGSAEAYTGWSGKLNGYLMASCVRNICTKNYQNLIIGFQVTIKNVGDTFLRHSVVLLLLSDSRKA